MKYPGWNEFAALIGKAHTDDMLSQIMNCMFTEEEKQQLGKRVLLTRALLKSEMPQRDISRKLNISISKITRGSNMLKSLEPKVHDYLNNIL